MPRPDWIAIGGVEKDNLEESVTTDSKKSSVTKSHPIFDSIALEEDKEDVVDHLHRNLMEAKANHVSLQ